MRPRGERAFPMASLVLGKDCLGKLDQESLDDLPDVFSDLGYGLAVEADIAERYAEGEVCAHLHCPGRFLSTAPIEPEPRCALLHACPSLGDEDAHELWRRLRQIRWRSQEAVGRVAVLHRASASWAGWWVSGHGHQPSFRRRD